MEIIKKQLREWPVHVDQADRPTLDSAKRDDAVLFLILSIFTKSDCLQWVCKIWVKLAFRILIIDSNARENYWGDLSEEKSSLTHSPASRHLRRQHLNGKIIQMDPQKRSAKTYILVSQFCPCPLQNIRWSACKCCRQLPKRQKNEHAKSISKPERWLCECA